jgi:hypothetical protein
VAIVPSRSRSWSPSSTRREPCSRRRRWSLTMVADTTTTMSTRVVVAPCSRPHQVAHQQPCCGGRLRPRHGGGRVSRGGSRWPRRSDWWLRPQRSRAAAIGSHAACGGSRRPRRSDWRWAASTRVATARWQQID